MDEFTPKLTNKQKRLVRLTRLGERLLWVLVAVVIVLLFVSAYAGKPWVGELVLIITGIICVFAKIASTTIFKLAIGFILAVPISLVLSPYSEIAENLAIYVFLLLTIGLILAALELFSAKTPYKRR